MPTTLEAVLILIFLLVPGFLALQMIKAPLPSTMLPQTHLLILVLLLSVLSHMLAVPLTFPLMADRVGEFSAESGNIMLGSIVRFDWILFIWMIVMVLAWPIFVGWSVGKLLRWGRLQRFWGFFGISLVKLTPNGWDWFFLTQGQGCWVIAETEKGRFVGGEFGTESFVSVAPHRKDIFIEREYYIDEDRSFGEPIPDSIGLWVNSESIKALHFYRVMAPGGVS